MERLRKKLRSQRGASILLALLLFLVCALVAASVLAAATANAGKARSNRVEQQKYLTLSSAVRLVCDELERMEYKGKYTVYEWTVDPVTDDDGNLITPSIDYFHCAQTAGDFTCGDLTVQLPLGKELDEIFSKQFEEKAGYSPLTGADVEGPTVHTLIVTLPDGLAGYPDSGPNAYQVPKEVTAEVKLDHATHHITLTAWLGTGTKPDGGSDTMIAELVAKEGSAPTLTYAPADRVAFSGTPSESGDTKTVAPSMKWELNWIKKGGS